jgi:hypothetical protein
MHSTTLFVIAVFFFYSTFGARTIKFTAAGGNQDWSEPRNWDCNCVPTASDDVIIDLPNINAYVTISTATCNSLTVGGTSSTLQSLTIRGSLTVGAGGGTIVPANGIVVLDAAPSSPFTTAGKFVGNSKFTFISGSLGGSGSFVFTNLNLTGSALKDFNASVTITGSALILPEKGGTGAISISGSALTVSGKFTSSDSLILGIEDKAKLLVTGSFIFNGAVSSTFTLRGYANFADLEIKGGTVIFNDAVDASSINIAQGGILNLIGTATRKINVAGAGLVQVRGGINTFNSATIGQVQLLSGTITSSQKLSISHLDQSGGEINGGAQIASDVVTLSTAVLTDSAITAQNLELKGFTSLVGTQLRVTGLCTISSASQLTMSSGALFSIESGGRVSHSAALKVLPSGTDSPPSFVNNGKWTQTSQLSSVVNTDGTGTWDLGPGSSIDITGINWKAGLLSLTSATFTSLGSYVNIKSIDGRQGVITHNGYQFVTTSLNVDTFNHKNGFTQTNTGTIGTFNIENGNVNVTTAATISKLNMTGGTLAGADPSAGVIVTVTNSTFTTSTPKTLENLILYTSNIDLNCPGAVQCQLFTINAEITTKLAR